VSHGRPSRRFEAFSSTTGGDLLVRLDASRCLLLGFGHLKRNQGSFRAEGGTAGSRTRLPPSSTMNFIDKKAIGEERFVPHDG
jgi:hypothetical protein